MENSNKNSKLILFNDINYAIYKIGNWKYNYNINLLGVASEIPVTEVTRDHVIQNMEEIRKATFEINGKSVNGIVGLAIQLNTEFKDENIEELIDIEEKEYENIKKELNSLNLKNSNDSIELDNDKFLIYKLEKDHHVTVSKPANDFTIKHHIEEIKKLKENQT